MPFLNQAITCPFCFSRFAPQEMLFRCVALKCTGRVPDTAYADARNIIAIPMGHVITPPKRSSFGSFSTPRALECNVCHQETRTRICPTCHYQLPHDIDQIDQRVIAIIGGSATGKSHYITTLVHRLQHEIGANFQFGLSMQGDETRTRWHNDFYRPLFEKHTILEPTQRVETNSSVKNPLIMRLTMGQGRSIHALDMSFFDTAGEDMAKLAVDTLSSEARYISQADGIIMLLDPLQVLSVRQRVAVGTRLPFDESSANPENIGARLHELLESRLHIKPGKKVQIPIAFTVSKVDALRTIVAPDSALLRPSEHFGYLDLDDIQSMHTEMEAYLQMWISPGFNQNVTLKFANYRFFGVSALGGQPDAKNYVEVNSLRVEDPFLWLLYQLKLIQAKKGR